MPVFTNLMPIKEVFDGFPDQMTVTEWNGNYIENGDSWFLPNRPQFVPSQLNINLNEKNKHYGQASGYFFIFSSIGPFFRIGTFNNEPLSIRVTKYLHELIGAPHGSAAHPKHLHIYSHKRYQYLLNQQMQEYFNDIYIAFANHPNPNAAGNIAGIYHRENNEKMLCGNFNININPMRGLILPPNRVILFNKE